MPEAAVGPGGDIVFRRMKPAYIAYMGYSLYVGDELFGIIAPDRGRRWTAISHGKTSVHFGVRMMTGFATRLDAATFIIKHHGYWMRDAL